MELLPSSVLAGDGSVWNELDWNPYMCVALLPAVA